MAEFNPFQIKRITSDVKIEENNNLSEKEPQQKYQYQLPPPTPTSPSLPPLISTTISVGRQQQQQQPNASQTASLLTPSSPAGQQTQFPTPTPTSVTESVTAQPHPPPTSHPIIAPQQKNQTKTTMLQNKPELIDMKIRKNACVVCSICFTCAKFYGIDCQCPEVQPRRGKNLPEGGLDSRAKKLHREDRQDYEFSIQWISENAHPMYRNKHNEVVGLRDLSEVSLCKAHSSTLYRAKKRHERNKEEDIHHTSADSNNEFASTEVTATIVQPQTPVSPADSCPQHTNMEEDSSVSAVKATLPRMGNHLPHQPLSTSSEYSLMRMIPSTFQSSDTNTIMGDMNTSLSHKRKRAAYQHHRTQSPNKINTSFIVQAQHHNQPKLSPHQSTSIYNGDRHPSNALTRNHLFIKKPQPHHNNTSTPNSTMNATDNNITPPVHTIPSQQYLLDRFSSSQLPPLQTSHHFSDKNNNKITATTSAKSSEQIHQPVPIQPHYSLVQPYPTANATSCVSSMSHTLPSPSMIPPSSISIMQHPQLSSSPYSFSGTAANNSKHSQVHSQQHESEDVIATSPKSHDSTSSVNNVSMGPTINRPNSSHSKSSKHEEDNDRLIIETVSLRPSLPPHPNPTSPYTAAVGSAATAATTDDNNYNARYYFRNLAITDNFTFRDLLAEVDIQGSPPPPGKRIVISDLSSERIYPLDRPIRDVITKPTSTHIELCLGLVDKPSIDWSAYS